MRQTLLSPTFVMLAVIFAATLSFGSQAKDFKKDQILGTQLSFSIKGVTQAEQGLAYQLVLEKIAYYDTVLSSYQAQSEISQLNHKKQLEGASQTLIEVLTACENYQQKTRNHFSCKLGSITALWQQAEQQQTLPDRINVRKQARQLRNKKIAIEKQNITLSEDLLLDINGLAKGYIIDAVYHALATQFPNSQFKLDIGGDGRHYGSFALQFTNTNFPQSAQVQLAQISNKAYAASGMAFRNYKIKHHTKSHILAPRDGWPIANPIGAAVIADTAITADAIATALTTMNGTQALKWLNQHDFAGLLYLPDGRIRASDKWVSLNATSYKNKLTLTYTIPQLDVTDYEKPYVAIWLSNNAGKPLKQLALLGDSERWWQENRKWWRKLGRKEPHIIANMAHATKRPGEYTTNWYGLDDFGNHIHDSQLVIHIEASREDGGHNYIRQVLDTTKPGKFAIQGKGEIGDMSLTIH